MDDLLAGVQQMSMQLRVLQTVVTVLVCCCVALGWSKCTASEPSKVNQAGAEPQHSKVLPLSSRLCVVDKCFLNVESFGAVGDDQKDCTISIQNALNAMRDGDVLFFPPGTYLTTSTINIGGSGGTLVGSAAAPKLLDGITVCGAGAIIHHNPGVHGKGFGHRVMDVHGPRCVLRDLSFVNRESYPHTGAGANVNVQMSAEFVELSGLFFDVTGQNPIVICCRGAHVHDCVVKSSPEHGVYLSGAAYNLQQPSDARIENNHFENIAKNGVQVQNANASEYTLPGTIISGNVFRNVNVGVFISESYVGLVLEMPITGKPPLGAIKGGSSSAMGHVDPGEWEAEPQCNPGWLRATALAASYPAEFRVGETLAWVGGQGVISAVHYDKVDKCIITGNQFLRDSTHRGVPNMPPTAPIIGVTMGNSSSDVLISGNIFQVALDVTDILTPPCIFH
jgi:hypothetical protein